ncbi:MAG: uracil-DNA glycosylase family protein [Chloroflexia bacterium]
MEMLRAHHSDILRCRKCEDAGLLGGAPRGRRQGDGASARRAGAGLRTMLAGKHFSGPGGKLLRSGLCAGSAARGPGLPGTSPRSPAASPVRPQGRRWRPSPSAAEVALCRPYLDREFELLDPPLVLLVGGMAIERYLVKAPLNQVVGELVERDGRHWLPLPHPRASVVGSTRPPTRPWWMSVSRGCAASQRPGRRRSAQPIIRRSYATPGAVRVRLCRVQNRVLFVLFSFFQRACAAANRAMGMR